MLKRIFWLAVFLLGRIPTDFLILFFPILQTIWVIPTLTVWSIFSMQSEVFWGEVILEKSILTQKSWLKALRENRLATNGLFNKAFAKFEMLVLFSLVLAPSIFSGTLIASELYSVAKPRYGKLVMGLAFICRFSYFYLGAKSGIKFF